MPLRYLLDTYILSDLVRNPQGTVAAHFAGAPVLAVTDSWFGNNGLFKPVRETISLQFQLLSRLCAKAVLYDKPSPRKPRQRGRSRKFVKKLGSVARLAARFQRRAKTYRVDFYGKRRELCAYSQILPLKTLQCPVRVVWVYRKTQSEN